MKIASVRRSILSRSSLLPVLLLCGMGALLIVLAVLQYRWTQQVAEATEARIGSNIEALMVDWHWAFYSQFSSICVALQVGPDSGAYDDWEAYRDRYARWRQESRYPDLIEHVYIWETSSRRMAHLYRLSPDLPLPEESNAAAALQPLLTRLQSRSADLYAGLRAWQLNSGDEPELLHKVRPYSSLSGWQFDPNIPALVHPIVHHKMPADAGPRASGDAVDWIVVVLNMQTLKRQIWPDLAARYFAHEGNARYSVAVAQMGDGPALLYASRRDFAVQDLHHADAVMNIFGPPPQSTEGYLWEALKNANSLQGDAWRNFQGPVWFPVIRYSSHRDLWALVLVRRAARLEDMLSRVRRNNLLISSVVLLLLAANISLVAITSYRAQRFAALQMDFVASVSHELRTPLAALFSAGENLSDGIVEDPKQLQLYGGIITSQARQLIGLVDQILAFASTRSGRRTYRKWPLNVEEVVDQVLKSSSIFAQIAGFRIEKQIPASLPPVVADADGVAQCLQNLIGNAVKYSGKSRWIGISAAAGAGKYHDAVEIQVRDRGIGIAHAELDRVFQPFYRSQAVKAAQIHGTGLGLAVARRIAEDMGGELLAKSEPGKGSIFILRLPAGNGAAVEDRKVEATL